MNHHQHWRLERDDDGLVWLSLDKAGAAANALSAEVLDELGQVLDQLDLYPPKGLIVRSAKAAGFIAGADIEEFTRLDTPEGAPAGGPRLELFQPAGCRSLSDPGPDPRPLPGRRPRTRLACRYRVAVDEAGTRLSLPGVMLGIFPRWGGMRTPSRTGRPQLALDLMLTGRTVDARKARLGLADLCVAPRVMDGAPQAGPFRPGSRGRATGLKASSTPGRSRNLVAAKARQQVAARPGPSIIRRPMPSSTSGPAGAAAPSLAPDLVDGIVASPPPATWYGCSSCRNASRASARIPTSKAQRSPRRRGRRHGVIAAWCALRV